MGVSNSLCAALFLFQESGDCEPSVWSILCVAFRSVLPCFFKLGLCTFFKEFIALCCQVRLDCARSLRLGGSSWSPPPQREKLACAFRCVLLAVRAQIRTVHLSSLSVLPLGKCTWFSSQCAASGVLHARSLTVHHRWVKVSKWLLLR